VPRLYDGPLDVGLAAVAAANAATAQQGATSDSTVLWGRRVRVTLDDGDSGVLIADHYPDRDDGLHVSVETELTLTLTPQPCRVVVWGLSAERRALLTAKQKTALNTAWLTRKTRNIGRIRVEAGRLGAFGVTFVGVLMKIEHARDGADWRTTITAQDGRLEWANARVTESIAPGVTYGVAVGQEQLRPGQPWPHGPHWLLLVSWGDPYGHLTPDQCVDLVHEWLRAAGWRPADGGERAAEICEAAGRRSAAK